MFLSETVLNSLVRIMLGTTVCFNLHFVFSRKRDGVRIRACYFIIVVCHKLGLSPLLRVSCYSITSAHGELFLAQILSSFLSGSLPHLSSFLSEAAFFSLLATVDSLLDVAFGSSGNFTKCLFAQVFWFSYGRFHLDWRLEVCDLNDKLSSHGLMGIWGTAKTNFQNH